MRNEHVYEKEYLNSDWSQRLAFVLDCAFVLDLRVPLPCKIYPNCLNLISGVMCYKVYVASRL